MDEINISMCILSMILKWMGLQFRKNESEPMKVASFRVDQLEGSVTTNSTTSIASKQEMLSPQVHLIHLL